MRTGANPTAEFVDAIIRIGDDPVKLAYARKEHRRATRGQEAEFVAGGLFLLLIVLPLWLLWFAWKHTYGWTTPWLYEDVPFQESKP